MSKMCRLKLKDLKFFTILILWSKGVYGCEIEVFNLQGWES